MTRFAVAEVVEEAVKSIRPLADDKGLSLEIEIAPGLHSVSDRRRLLQCLLNLLSNAVKYSEKGSIQCCAYAQDEQLMLRVTDNGQRTTDNGIGIAGEDLLNLFDAFERLESHLRVKAGGTGLGLYLTRKIAVELLNGRIDVESEKGQGSVFTLVVPKDIIVINGGSAPLVTAD
ncbi:MAG: ATP-binding protein [Sedimenticola sp.]